MCCDYQQKAGFHFGHSFAAKIPVVMYYISGHIFISGNSKVQDRILLPTGDRLIVIKT